MKTFEYTGNPPYPKYKNYKGILGECWLIIKGESMRKKNMVALEKISA